MLALLHMRKAEVIYSAMDNLLYKYELKTCFVHYTQHQKKVTPIFLRSCDYDNQAHNTHDTHRVNEWTLPLRNGTKKRVIFSISLMYSGEETCFSFSKNVWT